MLNAEDAGAEDARALSYRLFEIATQKGWASRALIYAALAREGPWLAEMAPAVIPRDALPIRAMAGA